MRPSAAEDNSRSGVRRAPSRSGLLAGLRHDHGSPRWLVLGRPGDRRGFAGGLATVWVLFVEIRR